MIMTRADLSIWSRSTPAGWLCPLSQDRPTYFCPKCGKEAMQFHHLLEDYPGREDLYRCCACGLFWEM